MRYLVLACDYDGTLATDGRVDEQTVAALKRCKETGRKLLLVTGRELKDLFPLFPELGLFDYVVGENGAVLYRPDKAEERPLADQPPDKFLDALAARGITPSVGKVIVATWQPHLAAVVETIQEFGLELQVIFNKGAVMVLPSGMNKATGMLAALKEMQVSPHNVVGIGDAENDHSFLTICEASAAVANALAALKERADIVTLRDHGGGVQDLVQGLLADDLASLDSRLTRHHLLLGRRSDGSEVRLPPHRHNLLVAGSSASGKSTLATAFLERLLEAGYQFCVIDPEGDYEQFAGAVTVGTQQQPPDVEQVLRLLGDPDENVVVNFTGVPHEERPTRFLALLVRLLELRNRIGRPHWIVIDEAQHVLPSLREPANLTFPRHLDRILLITVDPRLIVPSALAAMKTIISVGENQEETLRLVAEAVECRAPYCPRSTAKSEEVTVWPWSEGKLPFLMRVESAEGERRQYAEGELAVDRSFYFRGPDDKLKLRAQNLILFLQLAEGVDDETWLFHLRRGDYSQWFTAAIKDKLLGQEVAQVENNANLSPEESRRRIRTLVQSRYTLPAAATQAL